jgi:RsiW-degrading membrane proteinase PrsW (M82 family)
MSNPDTGQGSPQPSISTDTSRGATIRTAYVEREVKAYAIFENEIQTITMSNTLASVFWAVGIASLSFAVGIWTNAEFVEKLTPEGSILSHVIAPALCVVTVICWALAVWAMCPRRGTWTAVRSESKQAK